MARAGKCFLVFAVGLAISAPVGAQDDKPVTPVSAGRQPYPLAAKAAGIEGQVVVHGTIGKDGGMHNLRVVSGPQELRQAALNTVLHWVYKPFVHNGKVVEIDTTVIVNFNMGDKAEKAAAMAAAQAELAKANAGPTVAPAQPATPVAPTPVAPTPAPEHP